MFDMCMNVGNLVAQWRGCCAASRKIAGLIPAGVIGIFLMELLYLALPFICKNMLMMSGALKV